SAVPFIEANGTRHYRRRAVFPVFRAAENFGPRRIALYAGRAFRYSAIFGDAPDGGRRRRGRIVSIGAGTDRGNGDEPRAADPDTAAFVFGSCRRSESADKGRQYGDAGCLVVRY